MDNGRFLTLCLPECTLELMIQGAIGADSFLDEFCQGIQLLWPMFQDKIRDLPVLRDAPYLEKPWEIELQLVDNLEIQRINATHRHKDQPTDVLSFSLLSDSQTPIADLPEIALGSILISVPYAQAAVVTSQEPLSAYLLERFFHGCLHLLGQHHDTMADYECVKGLQRQLIDHWMNSKCANPQ